MPAEWAAARAAGARSAATTPAFELLRRPEVELRRPARRSPARRTGCAERRRPRLPAQVRAQVEVRAKYAGYIERQQDEIERQRRNEETRLPADLDYLQLAGLSHEVRQKLAEARPATLGQAGRMPGVTPAAVSILLVHLKKRG